MPGTRLEEGATYLDLRDPERRVFTGMNDMVAEPGSAIVPKSEVDFEIWNRLTGVTDPYRLGRMAA